MPTTPSVETLSEVRAGVLRRPGLVGAALRAELSNGYDTWLQAVFPADSSVPMALVAVGGLGRREPAPYGDLDLVLIHDGVKDIAARADRIWYPIWDSGIGLDHSVRTVDQAAAVAKEDVKANLGLLDVRHIAGDPGLTAQVRDRALSTWRAGARKRLPELRALYQQRRELAGEAAFLLEPNLKESVGGLRDGQLLTALGLAQLIDVTAAARDAYQKLLDVRGELQRAAGRSDDVMHQQEHIAIAEALGLQDADGRPDRDCALRLVNESARAIAHATEAAWRRLIDPPRRTSPRRRLFGARPGTPERVGLAKDVVAQGGEVVLARDADPWSEPALMLRAARAAAANELALAPYTLERLATESAPLRTPWPDEVRSEFVALLGTGAAAVPVLESLDLAGLWERLLPEWADVRCRAQHNPVHRYTVDRHLLETAARAAELTREVARPDLLLVAALLHDIGKGQPGDHSAIGAVRSAAIARRMGFSEPDVAVVTDLVRHHLLLPDTATRRDLDDPRTVELVAETVGDSAELLALLHALTIADGLAVGKLAWTDWKAELVADLVHRVETVVHGAPAPPAPELDDHHRALAEAGELAVVLDTPDTVTVVAHDEVGLLYRAAGVLALHSLDVINASVATHAGMAVNTFLVQPRFGRKPDVGAIRADLVRAVERRLGLAEKLAAKERAYRDSAPAHEPARILWFDDEATDATIMEVRTSDAIGLLFRLTAALERSGLDIRSARLASFGGSVVDAFYLTTGDGRPVPLEDRAGIEQAVREA